MADCMKVCESARQAAKVLHGFPLGLELAGILIHEGIVSLNAFPAMFETKYQQLTQFQIDPSLCLWGKSDSLFRMFDELYKSLLGKSASAALLLTLCSIYGPWEVPILLLQRLELFDVGSCTDAQNDWRSLKTLLQDEVSLNMAISELYRIFLAKKKQNFNGGLISISLHDSLCRWRFATIGDSRAEWIMQASYGLTRHVRSCCDW